jgi:DNA invertase Pin-like site-specific DNA recombinase
MPSPNIAQDRRRCRFVGSQQIDSNGTVGKMIAAAPFGVAEMEQHNRPERQAAGMAAAKQRSVYIGRAPRATKAEPRRPIGLREKGLTDGEIAAARGLSRRTLQRCLKTA